MDNRPFYEQDDIPFMNKPFYEQDKEWFNDYFEDVDEEHTATYRNLPSYHYRLMQEDAAKSRGIGIAIGSSAAILILLIIAYALYRKNAKRHMF